jgi:hypothetical protein
MKISSLRRFYGKKEYPIYYHMVTLLLNITSSLNKIEKKEEY